MRRDLPPDKYQCSRRRSLFDISLALRLRVETTKPNFVDLRSKILVDPDARVTKIQRIMAQRENIGALYMEFGAKRVNKIRVVNIGGFICFVRGNIAKPRRKLRQGQMDERSFLYEILAHQSILIAKQSLFFWSLSDTYY